MTEDDPDYGWLLARYSIGVRTETNDNERAVSALHRAAEIGERTGDQRLRTRAFAHLAQAWIDAFEPLKTIEAGDTALRYGESLHDDASDTRSHVSLADAYAALGDMEKATFHGQRHAGLQEINRYRALLSGTKVRFAHWARMAGRSRSGASSVRWTDPISRSRGQGRLRPMARP